MSDRVVLATRNAGKIAELHRILAAVPELRVELVGLEHFPQVGEIAETGATFAENALLKAAVVAEATGFPAIADDSGLCVDALAGMPGVFSARWSGRHGDDQANLELVLAQLTDVPPVRRGARFVCAAAVALPGGAQRVVEGELAGILTTAPRGPNGFGYDPIFVPVGEGGSGDGGTTAGQATAGQATAGRTTAELSAAEKDAISHRGRAFRALAAVLPSFLAGGAESTAPHSTAPHSTAPHSTAPHSTAPHSTAPHSTAAESAAPYSTGRGLHPLPSRRPASRSPRRP